MGFDDANMKMLPDLGETFSKVIMFVEQMITLVLRDGKPFPVLSIFSVNLVYVGI